MNSASCYLSYRGACHLECPACIVDADAVGVVVWCEADGAGAGVDSAVEYDTAGGDTDVAIAEMRQNIKGIFDALNEIKNKLK